jgi:hypothetical protein
MLRLGELQGEISGLALKLYNFRVLRAEIAIIFVLPFEDCKE